ncbi:acyl-CoA dehydrogenase family protein [Methylobacterium sp. J-030]|uniref:acyl-CoA dehydrogenase family protein n=1 Tax=Methylobacterium sp. J-030 TaxID=2836627 RepID=UPI001FBB9FA0|nr:acyl-CoA dehydrogenase family protein [Methylobacterium sp. J-030]MCJ2072194.1 acyl-CoA dehydrogenase family protein [Methylobacterium sp. J-030]
MAEFLDWPFFNRDHATFAGEFRGWVKSAVPDLIDHADVDGSCRKLVAELGRSGWLEYACPDHRTDGSHDVRTLCLAREILAYESGLADFAFAMQGLGSGPIALFGHHALKERYLPPVRHGRHIAAFALSEPECGSDVAAISTSVTQDGPDHVRIEGTKTWISNGGIADFYVVFARSGEGPGAKGLSAFVVDADTPGLSISERINVMAPHPLATLRFDACRVPVTNRLGAAGAGFKVAMATLDIFRTTVGAAALGLARRALDEALSRASSRRLFGTPLGELQLTQAALAEMATAVEASALLIYRAAWAKHSGKARITREAAMAKLFATDSAQGVIDRAVQIFGGSGVKTGSKVEELYREVRALRIYEGASEVQKIIIAREMLRGAVL